MKFLSTVKHLFLVGLFILLSDARANAWGFWAHQRINQMAIYTLPPSMMVFYKPNLSFITDHAVDADKRRYVLASEAPHHFIDLDFYGAYPFTSIPKKWSDAVACYGEDSLNRHGIVPWYVITEFARLTDAFRDKNKFAILRFSADLGHYIADANVPLHCTRNYDGQLTGQSGIHAFWESRIPELFGDGYDFFVGKAITSTILLLWIWKSSDKK